MPRSSSVNWRADVRSGADAASFYVYENRGVRVGQGADGFVFLGAAGRRMKCIVPLVSEHRCVLLHDDYWMSFLLRREGVSILDLEPRLAVYGVERSYRQVHEVGGLAELRGGTAVPNLNRALSTVLFNECRPTLPMRCSRLIGWPRGVARRMRRKVGAAMDRTQRPASAWGLSLARHTDRNGLTRARPPLIFMTPVVRDGPPQTGGEVYTAKLLETLPERWDVHTVTWDDLGITNRVRRASLRRGRWRSYASAGCTGLCCRTPSCTPLVPHSTASSRPRAMVRSSASDRRSTHSRGSPE